MKVAELLAKRRQNWSQLESLCTRLERPRRGRLGAALMVRFAALYRAACADLALADAYQLPPNTVGYLHQLVGRAHNQLYRTQGFRLAAWWQEMLVELPRRLLGDRVLHLAFCLFWGFFFGSMLLGYASQGFAESLLGEETLRMMEEMHSHSVGGRDIDSGVAAVGGYVQHNTSIGLQCFAFGLTVVMGLYVLVFNAVLLGTVFGHMITTPQRDNFFQFVTAHGPFELTAIVLSAAAGLKMGFSLIDTGGWSRGASLRRATREALPTACLAMIGFVLAAVIEGLISPSALPYVVKLGVAVASTVVLVIYFVLLGSRWRPRRATG